MKINRSKIIASLFISVAIVMAAYKLAGSWKATHYSYQTLSVTGLGTKDFTSDLVVWRASFSRSAYTLADANNQIKSDKEAVRTFLKKNGINDNEISFTAVQITRNYKSTYNNEGNVSGNTFDGFNLSQTLTVESKNLAAVEKMSADISDLIEKGIEFTAVEPDYYYTKLKDLKIELLKQATEDAYMRAQTISENSKSTMGNLKNANMGIFQITGQNTNEDYSWGGSFNTKAKYKTASITVKLEFDL